MNLNGRVVYGTSFLSPDPHIPDPTNTLSYNRYAYVNYNPLTLIDPSGFFSCTPSDISAGGNGDPAGNAYQCSDDGSDETDL